MVGHVPIAIRRALPHADGGEVLGLAGSCVPLVDGVVGDPVETHLPGAPRLDAGPLDAGHQVVGLTWGEHVDVAGGAPTSPGVDTDHHVAVGHPLLGIDHLPVLVSVARTRFHIGVLAGHQPPLVGVALLKGQSLGVRPVGEDDRVGAVSVGAVHVGPEDKAVVHLDGNVPIDVHHCGHSRPRVPMVVVSIVCQLTLVLTETISRLITRRSWGP